MGIFFCAKCSTLFTAQYPWADSKLASNDRLRYYVMTSLIGWAQALNQPCIPPHPQAKTLQMSKTNTKVSLSNNPKTMAICCQNHQTDIDVLALGQNGCHIADTISKGNILTENIWILDNISWDRDICYIRFIFNKSLQVQEVAYCWTGAKRKHEPILTQIFEAKRRESLGHNELNYIMGKNYRLVFHLLCLQQSSYTGLPIMGIRSSWVV